MQYRRIRALRPSVMFQLRVASALAYFRKRSAVSLPNSVAITLRTHLESLLLIEGLQPSVKQAGMLIARLKELSSIKKDGRPVIYENGDTLSLMFDDLSVQSMMSLKSPSTLVLGYTQTMMGFLLFNPTPKKIGMIGLGGGSLSKYCFARLPNSQILVAENNADVITLRQFFSIPHDNERFQVILQDGATFVQQEFHVHDILLVDGFDQFGLPPQLCSQRFYCDCYHSLTNDGILVVNLPGDEQEIKRYVDRIQLTFEAAVIVVDALNSLNKIVFAFKGGNFNLPDKVILDHLLELEHDHTFNIRRVAQRILNEQRIASGEFD